MIIAFALPRLFVVVVVFVIAAVVVVISIIVVVIIVVVVIVVQVTRHVLGRCASAAVGASDLFVNRCRLW